MFSFNSIRKNLRYGMGKTVAPLLLITATVSTLFIMRTPPLMAQFSQLDQHKKRSNERSTQLLAQLPPSDLLVATVTSEPIPQSGQRNRSSRNFSVNDYACRLRWVVLEDGVPNPNIRFNIMRDSGAKDEVLARGVFHGATTDNVFVARAIYIGNPSGAKRQFQVRAYKDDR